LAGVMAKQSGGSARFIIGICLGLMTACTAPDQSAGLYDELVSVEQQFMAAFEQGDAAGLAKLYDANAQLLPANRSFVSGRADIKAFWRGLMQLGITAVKLETLEVEGMGKHAYEVGRYTIHTADDQMIDFGKYIVTWHKANGQWSLYRHIWTTSMIKDNETKI
jgi:uncharacterized protein (TIGR02246 family)